jgi:cell division protein FtsZ
MHEINQAAETITAAADPEANIIFGATISPDLEGEMIITVVATGFDDAYFANRKDSKTSTIAKPSSGLPKPADDHDMTGLDMDLHDDEPDSDLSKESPMPNIWTLDETDDKELKDEAQSKKSGHEETLLTTPDEEDELEKPSFLRRLTKRRQQNEDTKSKSDSKDSEKDAD